MNKTELTAAITEKTGASKKSVDEVLAAFQSVILDEMKAGRKVQIPGFVTFEVVTKAERQGKNPATGEMITIPAQKAIKAKMSPALKKELQ